MTESDNSLPSLHKCNDYPTNDEQRRVVLDHHNNIWSVRKVHPVHMWFYSIAHPPALCTHVCHRSIKSLRLSSFGRSSRARFREQRSRNTRATRNALCRHCGCKSNLVPFYRNGSVSFVRTHCAGTAVAKATSCLFIATVQFGSNERTVQALRLQKQPRALLSQRFSYHPRTHCLRCKG